MKLPILAQPVIINSSFSSISRGNEGIAPSECVNCIQGYTQLLSAMMAAYQLCTPDCCDCLPAPYDGYCHNFCG